MCQVWWIFSSSNLQVCCSGWIPEMRISASKSEAMVLSCEKVACHFPVNDVLLSQIEKHKYLQFLLKVGQTGLLVSCLQ